MSELNYVPSGAFLLCNKCVAPVPMPLKVTSQPSIHLPGGLMATSFDELPVLNVPLFGVCGILHGPCAYTPLPPGWQPVQELVQAGPLGGNPLLETSKMHCTVGGEISIHLTRQAAMATLPDFVSRELADMYADLEGSHSPLAKLAQLQIGLERGAWQGLYAMGEGLVELAKLDIKMKITAGKAVVFAAQHPVEAAQAVAEGTQKAAAAGWQAVTDRDNWLTAGEVAADAVPGVLAVKGGMWLSDADNRAKLGRAYDVAKAYAGQLTTFEATNLAGRAAFEVVALFGAPETKVAELGKAGELVKGAEAAGEGLRLAGEVTTGAKGLAEAGALEKAPSTVEEVVAAIKECWGEGHPVDVANGRLFTQATDFTLPGPLPLVWERTWLSTSSRQGVLGHGWHHAYDLSLTPTADGGATLRLPDDRQVSFAPPASGQRCFSRRHKLELAHDATGFRVWDLRQRVWYVFEPAGADAAAEQRLAAVEDANGSRIQFAYTPAGHLAAITDSAGRKLPCETDAAGRLLALHAPDPDQPGATFALVRYAYDEAGDLTSATDALGHAARFAYAGHLLTRETFRSGLNFYFEYDGPGPTARCVHTWGDGGIFDTRLQYNTPTHTTVWDSYGHQKEYHHQRGLVIQRRDALGAVQKWRYSPAAELEHYTDPLGNMTRYEYDGRGNLVSAAQPDGAKVSTQFNEEDLPIQGTDALGNPWQWQYDAKGNLVAETDPVGTTTHYAYDAQGRVKSVTDDLGHTTRLRYDEQGNLAHLVASDDSIRSRTYDALGRLIELTDAIGNKQRYRYDQVGQLVGVHYPDGTTKVFAYDAKNQVVQARDGHQEATFFYNSLGLLECRRQAGLEIKLSYDREGRLTNFINEQGEHYNLALDATGQVVEEVGFDGLTRRYERDMAGRVTQVLRPAGRTTVYKYDAAGRVTEAVHNGTEWIRYRYRLDGALLEAANQTATVQFERDILGRLLCELQNGRTVSSSYDVRGQRQSLTSSLGAVVSFERDAIGRIRQTQANKWQSTIERDAEGLELQRQLSGGLFMDWHRDQLGRPTSQRLSTGSRVERRRYQWQGSDQLAAIENSLHGPTEFTYDSWGNLAAATYADGTQELRQPDAVGNLFRTHNRSDRRYGKGGQLRDANGTRYQYDEEGNLTQKTTPEGKKWHYAWNGAGQLVNIIRPDSYAVTFTYDALGRRVSKRFRGRVTRWVWDGDKPLHEWHELEVGPEATTIADVTTWLFEDDGFAPAAKLTAQGAYSIVCDHLGTPLGMYDGQGNPAWEMTLDSYGQVRQGRGKAQDCPFRYQGQYEDVETGLYYNRFRYYDPETGSYISQDPSGLDGGIKLYGYVSDPLTGVDIFGLSGSFDIIPYNTKLPAGSGIEKHHGLIDIWAEKNGLPNYTKLRAPTVTLTQKEHAATKAVYRDWLRARTGKPVGGVVDWTKVSDREMMALSEEMFDAAKVPKSVRQSYYRSLNEFLYEGKFTTRMHLPCP